jgi:CheY-like chemotaxis protein
MLEDMGCKVTPVANGDEALHAVERGSYSILLTDIAMPAMNGVELAHRVRELVPDMPVLFATGYADLQVFGEKLNDESVVRKPYRLSELAARIEAMIDLKRGENVIDIQGR